MSPDLILAPPRTLGPHPQRPWRRVESGPRRPSRPVTRTYTVAVVRELPWRGLAREAVETW